MASVIPAMNKPLGEQNGRTTSKAAALNRLREHISELSVAFVNTINERDWDSPLWENVATTFTTKPEALSGAQNGLNGRDAFIDSMKKLATAHPKWKINIKTMTVNLSDDHEYAEVFTNSLATGEPEGIARPAMTRLEYRLIKNKWWFVSHEILPGQPVDMMGMQDQYREGM